MRTSRSISDERLKEIASIVPTVDDEAPEITPEQASRARLARALKRHARLLPIWVIRSSSVRLTH